MELAGMFEILFIVMNRFPNSFYLIIGNINSLVKLFPRYNRRFSLFSQFRQLVFGTNDKFSIVDICSYM